MKKIISFNKELNFPGMIGEITSIALDNDLKFIDKSNIEGNFKISGTYKMTEATTFEEKFNYDIPVQITLTETFDLTNVSISIDDFHYEIVNDDILKCDIDVLIDGLEEIEIDDSDDERECDGDIKKEIEIPKKIEILEENEDVEQQIENKTKEPISENNMEQEEYIENNNQKNIEQNNQEDQNITSIFDSLGDADETFSTYSVYIYRKDDTIDKIINEYNTTREILNDYNDLDNIEIGSKIIIPNTSNE